MNNLTALVMASASSTDDGVPLLQPICGTPILRLVCRTVARLEPQEMRVVVGMNTEGLQACLEGLQAQLVSLEDSHDSGCGFLRSWNSMASRGGELLLLHGPAPRMTSGTLRRLIDHHRRSNAATTRLTAEASRSGADGAYCFGIESLLQTLNRLADRKEPIQLSRILEAQRAKGERVEALAPPDEDELRTIAGFRDLADVTRAFRAEKNRDLMDSGVTLIDPENTYVDLEVLVEKGALLHPLVTLEGNSQIGAGSEIRSGTRISDSRIGPGVLVLDGCVIVESEVETGTTVGPFAHLRSQVMVAEDCRVGNFVELKKSRMGKGSKAAHLAYLGDATIGEGVNVGAGTITCNYDGTHKHPTIIEDGVFVGTDSQLVAPVRIGRGSYVAAGSCITEDVPPESLAIARSRQTNKTGWKRSSKERKND